MAPNECYLAFLDMQVDNYLSSYGARVSKC
jgi:hypothetical protein